VRSATSLKREMILGMALTAFVIVCAWAWGAPFVAAPAPAAPVQAHSQVQTANFMGTIVRDGEQFFLREGNGPIYRLDDAKDAQSFEGRPVLLTGWLDPHAKLIHVERIAPATT
jgi:hypothetical protein